MNLFRSLIAAAALLTAAPAFASTLASGVLESTVGSTLVCQITNLGTTPLSAQVYLRRSADGSGLAINGSCASGQVAPGSTCDMYNQSVAPASGYCRATAPGSNFRGSLLVVNASGVVTSSLPLTK